MEMKILIVVLVCVISENDSAIVLGVFPIPSISHQVVLRKITQELANRGYNVTVITTDPVYPKGGAPQNYNEIDVHDISYKNKEQFLNELMKNDGGAITFKSLRNLSAFFRILLQFETKEVQVLVSKKIKFDLILIESFMRPALFYSHIFKAPVIYISSLAAVFSNNRVLGSPTHPILYPTIVRIRLYNLSLTEKIRELYTHYSTEYADYLNEQDENIFLKEILERKHNIFN